MALSEDMCEDGNDNNWRNGPAKLWYDMLELPNDCHKYDYGFKLANPCDDSVGSAQCMDNEDAFNLVSQTQWERDVIWDGTNWYKKVMETAKRKAGIAGWLPNICGDDERVAPMFVQQKKRKLNHCVSNSGDTVSNNNDKSKTKKNNGVVSNGKIAGKKRSVMCSDNTEETVVNTTNATGCESSNCEWFSTMDIENEELIRDHWEERVIWDPNAMKTIPSPKVLPIDPCDIINLQIIAGEDTSDSDIMEEAIKKLHNSYNISNDEYYESVVKTDTSLVSNHHINILHSIPALELYPMFFPRSVRDYHKFYRPELKRYSRGALASIRPQNVQLCTKLIRLKKKLCDEESHSLSESSNFLMKTPKDLSAIDGDIVLTEYIEDYPPLKMQPGMGFKIINYYKKASSSSNISHTALRQRLDFRFGDEKQVLSRSPFLGDLTPGQNLQAIESNLFRAPIFEHNLPEKDKTDFLVIRTRECYYIREIDAMYTMGQQLPLIEVPALRSKKSNDLINNFIQATVHRMFKRQKAIPGIKDELKKFFVGVNDDRLKRCITSCARYQETSKSWILKNNYTEEQIRSLISPEECCALYSMLIAQKLGYGDRLVLDENDDDCSVDIAPWNTTHAYVTASKGNQWLNVNKLNSDGSLLYSLMSNKQFKVENPYKKKCEPLSDRSLKRKPLKFFHEWLINYGIDRDQVKQIKNRFEASDLVKQFSNQIKKKGYVPDVQISKSAALAQQYKDALQDIFERQIYRCSREQSSSDECSGEDTEECDSELEEMGKDLEKMLVNNKSKKDIEREREEKSRKELYQLLYGDTNNGHKPVLNGQNKTSKSYDGKLLRIFRTFIDRDGVEYTRTETVRKPEVINAYVRISETKDKNYIQRLSFVRNHNENELKLSAIKPKTKAKTTTVLNNSLNNSMNTTNSACNKRLSNNNHHVNSAKRSKRSESANERFNNSIQLSRDDSSDVNSVRSDSVLSATEQLVRVDDCKLTFSKKVVEDAHEIEEKERRKEEGEDEHIIVMTTYTTPRTVNRRRVDPVVKLVEFLDQTIVLVRKLEVIDDISIFNKPVTKKNAKDYFEVIKNPMDLKTMREKNHNKEYSSHLEFLADMELILVNAIEYNGNDHQISLDAKAMLDYCIQRFEQNKEFLNQFESAINPWVSGGQKDRISYILREVYDKLMLEPGFEQLKILGTKNTYKTVCTDKPIDYNIIGKKIKDKAYESFDAFRNDCNLVHETCNKSYYSTHLITMKAKEIAVKAELELQQNLKDIGWNWNTNQSAVLTNILNTISKEDSIASADNVSNDDQTSVQ